MSSNKKQRLFIIISSGCLLTLGVIPFLYYLKKPRNLNVILITIDALRPDHLGCYGYKRNTSPNIDKLAKEGVLFTQAISASSSTPPSMGSILTSTMPNEHLLTGWWGNLSLNPQLLTITEILKFKGYKTVFVGGNVDFKKINGLNRGFEVFHLDKDSKVLTNKVIELLNNYSKNNFFIWIHYMNTHIPYSPSEAFEKFFVDDELYNKHKTARIVKTIKADLYGFGGIQTIKNSEISNPDYYIAQYDAAIRTVDEEISRILNELSKLKLDKKTIIIITSDHGELLGEHNCYFFHGIFLYEPLIKIPLVLKCNRIIPKDKIIKTKISAHLDIAPTVIDILKLDKPNIMKGISLVGIAQGRKKYPKQYVFTDEGRIKKCISTESWKLIYSNNDKYELYNLANDPNEFSDVVSVEQEEFSFLKQKLDGYKWVSFQNNISNSTLDEETKEQLKSLGYAQ